VIYYANGFAWRKVGDGYGVLQCAPIEDEADEAAWCDVAGFNAEPEKQDEIEAVRDALFAIWLQEDAAYLYREADKKRDSGALAADWSATVIQVNAARSAALGRELMGAA
jgi:hypothetical protein